MQRGQVDMVIVGTDRTTAQGDVCNKIGTYLKALAARDNGVPFYVALPSPTVDWTVRDGLAEIPIEERSGDEVTSVWGRLDDGSLGRCASAPTRPVAATPPSTSRPRASSPGSSPNAGSAPPRQRASPPSSPNAGAPDRAQPSPGFPRPTA